MAYIQLYCHWTEYKYKANKMDFMCKQERKPASTIAKVESAK